MAGEDSVERTAGVAGFLRRGLDSVASDVRSILSEVSDDSDGLVVVRRSLEEIRADLGAISTLTAALTEEIDEAIQGNSPDGLYNRLLSPSEWGHTANGTAQQLGFIESDLHLTLGETTIEFKRNHRLAAWNVAMCLRREPHFTLADAQDIGFAPGQRIDRARASLRQAVSRTNADAESAGIVPVHIDVVRGKARYRVDEGLTIIEKRPEFLPTDTIPVG